MRTCSFYEHAKTTMIMISVLSFFSKCCSIKQNKYRPIVTDANSPVKESTKAVAAAVSNHTMNSTSASNETSISEIFVGKF